MLSDLCKKVTLVQNLAFFTGEQKLLDQLKQKDNVDFITSCVVDALNGGDELTGITIRNTETGETRELTVDGIFVAIGQVPENEPFKAVVPLNEWGYIVSDESCAMGKGVFVAGDCRTKQVRQIATAISDGAVAAVAACRWLDQ